MVKVKNHISVLIVDAQFLTRTGLSNAISGWIPGAQVMEARTADELWSLLSSHRPTLLIIDTELIDFSVPEDIQKIKNEVPEINIFVISDDFETGEISHIWDYEVSALLLKNADDKELEFALQACLSGKRYIAPALVEFMMREKEQTKDRNNPLTRSELEIVRLIGQGLTTKEIASQRHLSFHTVITHRRNIFKKVGVSNVSELVMYAIRKGIIPTSDYSI